MSYCNLDRDGSSISVASKMKFVVTTFKGWKWLAVATEKSILVPTDVLDPPLLETGMNKSNKYRMSGREFYLLNKYFAAS